jgi:hypothetical protein
MRRFGWVAFALVSLMLAGVPAARAEKRIALLIGNESYSSQIGQLANPHNDVALIEQALKGLDFEVVTVHDAGLGTLTRAVNAYSRRLQAAGPGAIGFFYYSGHGASDGSANYLIPIDVKTTEAGELWDQSLQLTEITRKLKRDAGSATHFVVFDACRNTLKLTQPGSRAVMQFKGFVPVTQENGMLIAYATAEGELASDVGAGAGPYAKVLAEEVIKPGVEAVAMFRIVQRRVRVAIRQEPYLGFSALGDVYLAGKSDPPIPTPSQQSGFGTAEREWQQYAKDTRDIRLLEAFKEKHKADPVYVRLAEVRIEELKNQTTSAKRPSEPAKQGLLPERIEELIVKPSQPDRQPSVSSTAVPQFAPAARAMKINQKILVGHHSSYHSDCKPAGRPRVTVKSIPKYGRVSLEEDQYRYTGKYFVVSAKNAARCAGTLQNGVAVYYIIEGEFSDVPASDSFEVSVHYWDAAPYGRATWRYNVDIAKKSATKKRLN